MTDNTAIQELLTRVMKWKTFDCYCGTLFANMLEEKRGLFFLHVNFFNPLNFLITVQLAVSIDLVFITKNFVPQKIHVAPSIT